MSRRRPDGEPDDPGLLLLRALLVTAPRGLDLELTEMTSTAWASATFIGARHAIAFTGQDGGEQGSALAPWLAGLADAEWRLRGHLVIDLAVTTITRREGHVAFTVEALTIADA